MTLSDGVCLVKKALFLFLISILASTSILAMPTSNLPILPDRETAVLNNHRSVYGWGNNTRTFHKTGTFNTVFMDNQPGHSDYSELPSEGCEDAIIKISSSPIPEPVTLILFGIGLAGLGLRRRK